MRKSIRLSSLITMHAALEAGGHDKRHNMIIYRLGIPVLKFGKTALLFREDIPWDLPEPQETGLTLADIMSAREIAIELDCSVATIYNKTHGGLLVNGKFDNGQQYWLRPDDGAGEVDQDRSGN